MIVDFSKIDFGDRPTLILKNANDVPIGVLGYAKNISLDLKYNEVSTIEFEIPNIVDDSPTPFYDEIRGMRIVELFGVGQFTLFEPSESGDGIYKVKTCKGYSLEYEFAYKKLSLPKDTYRFWNADPTDRSDTIVGIIMEFMPSWNVGNIDDVLCSKYRTFEVNNESLLNIIKGSIQESYNCIFYFDTMTRTMHVKDADSEPHIAPVFISTDNLVKSIEITENTENIVTRLDVNGADGVSIRDVNPCGTNRIINLDYFMTLDNFHQELIDKYFVWKDLCVSNKQPYYNASIMRSLKTVQKITEVARLADLNGELTDLDNQRAVILQSIAQNLSGITQSDLDNINEAISEKKSDINAHEALIQTIDSNMNVISEEISSIVDSCKFETYFDTDEIKVLDRYIKDGEITESSFVASDIESYGDAESGSFTSMSISVSGCNGTGTGDGGNLPILYDVKGGSIMFDDDIDGEISAELISAIIEIDSGESVVLSANIRIGNGFGNEIQNACFSITGTKDDINVVCDEDDNVVSIDIGINNGYKYASVNSTEYKKMSVEWELFEYGEKMLDKLSKPSYTFSVSSANFLVLKEFVEFKNKLSLGDKIYVDTGNNQIIKPIAIGIKARYEQSGNIADGLELEFSDSFVAGDSNFKLVDLLEKSVSMGKNVELSKYSYSSFVDSGASNSIRRFMTSALDVAKNSIISSSNQAISWDASGIRLRKWANEDHTGYDDEQIWMNNNSIMMTDDGWQTAELAIGKFYDENSGMCWGVVAPRIVGTLLAGESLVIDSVKKDGSGTSQFRVDGNGCRIHNSDISITKQIDATHGTEVILSPEHGIAIGAAPLIESVDNVDQLNQDNANLWIDTDGNLNFKGSLRGATGEFTGSVTATEFIIDGDSATLAARVNEVAARGRNLLIDSSDERSVRNSITSYIISDYGTDFMTKYGMSGRMSFDAKATSIIPIDFYPIVDKGDGTTSAKTNLSRRVDVDTNWQRYSISVDFAALDGNNRYLYIRVRSNGNVSNGGSTTETLYIRNVKFEVGNTATAWSSAPEDAFTDIDDVRSYIENNIATALDNKIETFYQSTDPKNSWNASDYAKHTGDLWYNTSSTSHETKRWNGSEWQIQNAPKDVFDKIDGKKTVFTAQPTPPYSVGDMWYKSDKSLYVCKTARASGSYTASDWEELKYANFASDNRNILIGGTASFDIRNTTKRFTFSNSVSSYLSRCTNQVTVSFTARTNKSDGTAVSLYPVTKLGGTENVYFNLGSIINITSTATKYTACYTFPARTDGRVYSGFGIRSNTNYEGGSSTATVYVENIKLEIGDVATAWSASPEDLSSDLFTVKDGSVGLDFKITDSANVSKVTINKAEGVKVIGNDNSYFQATAGQMGFFKSNGDAMLSYADGNMALTGTIHADSGDIGGWDISESDGLFAEDPSDSKRYISINPSEGIEISSAIAMKPDGTFIIRNNESSDDDDYALKLEPQVSQDGNEKEFNLYLGNVTFGNNFVLPVSNGGTGAVDGRSIASATGIYKVSSKSELPTTAAFGDIGVVYGSPSTPISVSSTALTTPVRGFPPSSEYLNDPGYLALRQTASSNNMPSGVKPFGIQSIRYWNVRNLSGQNVSNPYARVGAGTSSGGACGLFLPLSVTGGAINRINLNFTYNLRPSGSNPGGVGDLVSTIKSGIKIDVYRSGDSTPVAYTSYTATSSMGNSDKSVAITLDTSSNMTSGRYYVVFYTSNTYSLTWIKTDSISISGNSGSGQSADAGIYIRMNNGASDPWTLVAAPQ